MRPLRVTLARVLDRWGKPGARLRKTVHPASLEVEAGLADYGTRWLRAAGARDIRPSARRRNRLSGRRALVRHRTDE